MNFTMVNNDNFPAFAWKGAPPKAALEVAFSMKIVIVVIQIAPANEILAAVWTGPRFLSRMCSRKVSQQFIPEEWEWN